MFCEGWYNPLHNAYAKLIREEASYIKAGRPKIVSRAEPAELVELTRDASPAVRYHAAMALGEHKTAGAAEALCSLLEDESIIVRRAAAEAIGVPGQIDAEKVVPALMSVLAAKEAEMGIVKRYASLSLGNLGPPAVAPLVTMIAGAERIPEKYAVKALGATGTTDPAAVELIVAQLESKVRNPQVRIFACEAAGEAGMTAAVPALIATLDHETETVVEAAIWALGEIGDDRAVQSLIGLFDRSFKTWAKTRIPGEIDEALKKTTGKDLVGKEHWRTAFPAGK
ncbi:MAG: HEAT repeat domain-containing protein [Planctomycetota bacterium]